MYSQPFAPLQALAAKLACLRAWLDTHSRTALPFCIDAVQHGPPWKAVAGAGWRTGLHVAWRAAYWQRRAQKRTRVHACGAGRLGELVILAAVYCFGPQWQPLHPRRTT